MIETLISSKTRVKLLLKFFLNGQTQSYLRNLEEEFGESTNAIRLELNKFEKAGMLNSNVVGNKKLFKANTSHPLFNDLNNIIYKYVGLDKIVESVLSRLGNLDQVYLVGTFSKGLNSNIIDLIFIGEIDKTYLLGLVEKVEQTINKKLRYVTYQPQTFTMDMINLKESDPLLLWSKDR